MAVFATKPTTVIANNQRGIEIINLEAGDLPDVIVVGVYKPPTVSATLLTQVLLGNIFQLSTRYAVVIGDMNHDLN